MSQETVVLIRKSKYLLLLTFTLQIYWEESTMSNERRTVRASTRVGTPRVPRHDLRLTSIPESVLASAP